MAVDKAHVARRKPVHSRPWLVIDQNGKTEVIEADKHAIMRRVSIPARDLRILDSTLSYPSTLLGREKAIVVNLDEIKCIITANEVLMLNWKNPEVSKLVDDLKHKLPAQLDAFGEQVEGDRARELTPTELAEVLSRPLTDAISNNLMETADKETKRPTAQGVGLGVQSLARAALRFFPNSKKELSAEPELDESKSFVRRGGPNALPFEFRALEACLGAACGFLEKETNSLETVAFPALDELTGTISTLNLERVRQIKSRLVTISGKVQKVRDEVEHLLDDDGDMSEMYLTHKMKMMAPEPSERHNSEASSRAHGSEPKTAPPPSFGFPEITETDAELTLLGLPPLKMSSEGALLSTSSSFLSNQKARNVDELEMLLEAYFVRIEGALNRLTNLKEYVDDTEDYIKLMLDEKQNRILQMTVGLTGANLFAATLVGLTAVFAMNIQVWLYDHTSAYNNNIFFIVNVGGTVGSIVMYLVLMLYLRWKGLMR